jgi:hypothetical protein
VFVELAKRFILGSSMLVARRDPPFHVDAKDAAPLNPNVYPPPRASRAARIVTAMQLIGSLLAVPVGIASAYSFYRANFAPETTCQNLRSGIISLLDKSVDASTRRMLVRRDVEEFEKNCAAVDPDATAAFKSLLAAEKTATPAAPAAAPAAPKVQRTETAPPKEAVRKPDPRPQVTAKPPATNPAVLSPAQVPAPVAAAPAVSEPAKRDPAVADTQWLDAVRQALVTRKPEPPTPAPKPTDPRPTEAKPQPIPAPAVRSVPQETSLPPSAVRPVPQDTTLPPARQVPQETALPPAPVAPVTAPALPPPIAVAPPTVRQVDTDHPVPPEAIPDPVPPADAGDSKSGEQDRSHASKWISKIPLLGPVIDNARR